MFCNNDISTNNEQTVKVTELLEFDRLEDNKGSSVFNYKCKSFQDQQFTKTEGTKANKKKGGD
eukprot:7207632-Ditylum_brightwellii.AAC.1